MNLDPNPQPKPNLNNPSKLLDTINLLAYNVRYRWQTLPAEPSPIYWPTFLKK